MAFNVKLNHFYKYPPYFHDHPAALYITIDFQQYNMDKM